MDIDEQIKDIQSQISSRMGEYAKLPKGCNCNEKGREKNKVKMQFMRDQITPLKNELKKLKREKHGLS